MNNEIPKFAFKIEELKEIALAAGRAIMDIYESAFEGSIELKADRTPVTEADKRANEIIIKGLGKLEVQYPVISEESYLPDYNTRKEMEYFWLVDPLDGTKEFINRNGDFTVNIALVKNNRPVFGCIYIPVSGQFFWGLTKEGAFMDVDGAIQRLACNPFPKEGEVCKVLTSRSYSNEKTMDYINGLQETQLVRRGSSLKMLLIAMGEGDIYPRFGTTMEWDTAAAQIILEEAGGSIKRYEDGKALVYNKEDLRNPHFIARGKTM